MGIKIRYLVGRGSWIRTSDLQYPKLLRYQAALYPEYPEHDSTELNHALALSFCLSVIFSENRVSTCPDHALGSDVDTRLRRDQQAATGRFIGRQRAGAPRGLPARSRTFLRCRQ